MIFGALIFLFLLSGCGAPPPAPWSLPDSLGAEWTLEETSAIDLGKIQGQPAVLGVEEALSGRYEGPQPLLVTCYRMRTGNSAFELMQKWRPSEGQIAVYRGPWFATLEGESISYEDLSALAEELEQALPAD